VGLDVEGPGFGGIAQRGHCFGMSPLPRKGHPEVERGVRVLGATLEHEAKRPLGLREPLLLQTVPTLGEAGVDTRYRRPSHVAAAGFRGNRGDDD
jgi:hypothetical protein